MAGNYYKTCRETILQKFRIQSYSSYFLWKHLGCTWFEAITLKVNNHLWLKFLFFLSTNIKNTTTLKKAEKRKISRELTGTESAKPQSAKNCTPISSKVTDKHFQEPTWITRRRSNNFLSTAPSPIWPNEKCPLAPSETERS